MIKKINLIVLILFIGFILIFSGCESSENDDSNHNKIYNNENNYKKKVIQTNQNNYKPIQKQQPRIRYQRQTRVS